MQQYKLIEHTADIRLYVEGSTLQELFNAALCGMSEIISPGVTEQMCTEQITIEMTSVDITTLLVDFMSDILTYTHITNALFYKAKFDSLEEHSLKATVYGAKVDRFKEAIKSVSYHEAEIKKNKQGNYETIIVLDR